MPEDFAMPPGGLHIRWPDAPLEQEARLMGYKWYAALPCANRLNQASSRAWNDRFRHHRQRQGVQRHAPGARGAWASTTRPAGRSASACTRSTWWWPLEATITRDFARRPPRSWSSRRSDRSSSTSSREQLYNWRPDVRPNVLGKFDEPEGDGRRRVGDAQPDRELAAARRRPT